MKENCDFRLEFPNDEKFHCMAYSQAIRFDGKLWAHYPICNPKDCPYLHPELIKDAVLIF